MSNTKSLYLTGVTKRQVACYFSSKQTHLQRTSPPRKRSLSTWRSISTAKRTRRARKWSFKRWNRSIISSSSWLKISFRNLHCWYFASPETYQPTRSVFPRRVGKKEKITKGPLRNPLMPQTMTLLLRTFSIQMYTVYSSHLEGFMVKKLLNSQTSLCKSFIFHQNLDIIRQFRGLTKS